jgi:hypothetical protein
MSPGLTPLAAQPGLGGRQQPLEHQLAGRDVLVIEPGEVGADALAGRGVEVGAGLIEVHAPGHVVEAVAELDHEATPQRGVGDLVDRRRSGRHDAVLDPQVGLAVEDAVARPVPPVDRAVVQAQGLELRRHPAVEHRHRILVEVGADQGPEPGDVLLEDLDHRVADPAGAEADPGLLLADRAALGAGVDRLAEQRDPGLGPQPLAEQDGRVRRHRHQRPGQELGQVVVAGELLGADLEVDLEARVTGLDHHRVVGQGQLVEALDRELELAAAHGGQDLVELEVALGRHHAVEPEVAGPHRGQDAHEHDLHAELAGRGPGLADQVVELSVHLGQAVAAEHLRVAVGLELELAELGGVVRVGLELVEERQHPAGRGPLLVEQEQLLLGADAPDAGLEPLLGDHAVERAQVGEDRAGELALALRVERAVGVLVVPGRRHRAPSRSHCASV